MKKIYIKIDGITCEHCKTTITKTLMNFEYIKNVIFYGNIAEVEYKGKIDKQTLIDAIIKIDYYTDIKMVSDNRRELKRNISLTEIFIIALTIILIVFALNRLIGFNIFNMIPVIDAQTTFLMLFVTGVLTSIHCVSMCGAINLIVSTSYTKNFKKPILYNLGRITSYTLVGGIVGLLGSVLQINMYVQGTIIVIAAVLMFFMSLSMMGIINFSFKLKTHKIFNSLKIKGSFMVGLLNGLMPCGPLQAMQIYALSTGSFIHGALSMFIFCLGTIPLMLFVGMISNFLDNKNRKILNKVSTVLILLLSLIMLNRGLLSIGVDISNIFKPNYDNYIKAEIKEDYQVIEFDLSYSGYKDVVVQKDITVRMIINTTNIQMTGCNNSIIINELGIKQDLKTGQNIIEFTPTETGPITYTCWMNMLKNKILVIDDMDVFKN